MRVLKVTDCTAGRALRGPGFGSTPARKLVLCLLLVSGSASAQGLLAAYELARDQDPKWRGAGYEFKASSETEPQARAALLPTAAYNYEYVLTDQHVARSSNPAFAQGDSRFGTQGHVLTLNQPIYRASALARLAQSRVVVKQAATTLAAAEQDLMLRVATAYLGVLAARDGQAFARAEREAVARQFDLARLRLEGGVGNITGLEDARARAAVTQAREVEAGNRLDDAQQALREITGQLLADLRPLGARIPMGPPEPAVVDNWLATAERQNLRLEARRQGVEVADQEIRRQESGRLPTLNLAVSQNNRRAGGSLFGAGSKTHTTEIALQLQVPIYDGGSISSLAREAVHRHQKAVEELEAERRALARQTRAAFLGVTSGVTLVQALGQTVQAQEKSLEAKQEGRRAGLITVLPVLDATRDLFAARRDYAQARYDYLMHRLRLKEAAGSLAESDLAEINGLLE